MHPIDQAYLSTVKPSFVTRRVKPEHIAWLETGAGDLVSGDLVLAHVEELGHHSRLERPDGRRAMLFAGDEVLLACGARYAPDQFEADCPTSAGPAHLTAAGGIAGQVRAMHRRMKPATRLWILGAVCKEDGSRINLSHYALKVAKRATRLPVLAVCGTSMNAGKTHTIAALVRGLSRVGHRVAAIKVTGTGAGGDLWFYRDSGAHHVGDFTDVGFASTYRAPVERIFEGVGRLFADAEAAGADVIVLELADGLLQQETAEILQMAPFQAMLTSLVFAAQDAMGAQAGADWLRRFGLPLQAVSGAFTQSPLAVREVAATLDLPVLMPDRLQDQDVVAGLLRPTPAVCLPATA
ncbi:MAG: hypothetical protein AAF495_06240 [Pseudomonadota bacterium]